MTLLLSTLWAQAARDWNPPSGNQYPSHAVVYATLFDASGQEVDNVADMRVGAFIDGECRAAANPVVRETPNGGRYIYTLRIGVNDADKGKKVQFVLQDIPGNEYVLPETITVTGGDETVGGVPSNPFHLTFTPITAINGPSELHVNMGETVNLREKFSFEPEGASLPEVLPWVKDTCSSFTIVNDVLTPVRTGSWAYFDLSISGCWHRTELFIHQPITGLAINDTDYPGGVITVPVNGDGMLNRALENILIIRPANATEKVKWTPSDPTAIVDTQGGWWNPVKPGTYTMTATAPGVDPVTVTVKIIQPVERMTPNYDEIRLRVGDELTQYLPYTYTIYPENATDKEAGISYGISSEDGILQRNDDGTIKAVNSGSTTVWVYHKDIPNGPISLSVYVIDFPSKESLTVKNDPFSVTLADYELSQKVDIYQRLVDNIENTGTIDFPYEFDFAEDTAGEGILMLYTDGDDKVNEVSAEQYGSTAVKWTYNRTAMGFNEDGSFNADKEYNFSVGFKLNIVVGLADVWLDRLQMDVNDTEAVMVIKTRPENFLLDEKQLTWRIPPYSDTDDTPVLEIGDRIEGKNEWKVTANRLGNYNVSISYGQFAPRSEVEIGQRLLLGEGWSWISLFANKVGQDLFYKYFYDAQEVRSQYMLVYNDPEYGFFGDLKELTTAEAYKVCVKDGAHFDMFLYDGGVYNYNTGRDINLMPGWTWVSNPYCFDHDLQVAFGKATFANDSRIVSKNDGFATFQDGQWVGTLTRFNAGEGYLVYNAAAENAFVSFAAEGVIPKAEPRSVASARRAAEQSVWSYDGSRFADNMSVICQPTTELEADRYTIGAFVGDECRGEGRMINGRFFVTVHGEMGEKVSFRLYDALTGEYFVLDDAVDFASTVGTYQRPMTLNTPTLTGIDSVTGDQGVAVYLDGGRVVVAGVAAESVEVYNASGMRVAAEGLGTGVYVVRVKTASGTIKRVNFQIYYDIPSMRNWLATYAGSNNESFNDTQSDVIAFVPLYQWGVVWNAASRCGLNISKTIEMDKASNKYRHVRIRADKGDFLGRTLYFAYVDKDHKKYVDKDYLGQSQVLDFKAKKALDNNNLRLYFIRYRVNAWDYKRRQWTVYPLQYSQKRFASSYNVSLKDLVERYNLPLHGRSKKSNSGKGASSYKRGNNNLVGGSNPSGRQGRGGR